MWNTFDSLSLMCSTNSDGTVISALSSVSVAYSTPNESVCWKFVSTIDDDASSVDLVVNVWQCSSFMLLLSNAFFLHSAIVISQFVSFASLDLARFWMQLRSVWSERWHTCLNVNARLTCNTHGTHICCGNPSFAQTCRIQIEMFSYLLLQLMLNCSNGMYLPRFRQPYATFYRENCQTTDASHHFYPNSRDTLCLNHPERFPSLSSLAHLHSIRVTPSKRHSAIVWKWEWDVEW